MAQGIIAALAAYLALWKLRVDEKKKAADEKKEEEEKEEKKESQSVTLDRHLHDWIFYLLGQRQSEIRSWIQGPTEEPVITRSMFFSFCDCGDRADSVIEIC